MFAILQAETLDLAFDECRLSDQALQDLEEALRLSLRLRHLALLDVLPSMLSMVAGLSGLEVLSLVNISGTDADLGPSLQVFDRPLPFALLTAVLIWRQKYTIGLLSTKQSLAGDV